MVRLAITVSQTAQGRNKKTAGGVSRCVETAHQFKRLLRRNINRLTGTCCLFLITEAEQQRRVGPSGINTFN